MKKLLLTTTALVAFAAIGSAGAAEIAVKAPRAAPVVAPIWNWTGFYIGANGGGGWSANNAILTGTDTGGGGIMEPLGLPKLFASASTPHRPDGALGGVQAGYNWQAGTWLLGMEGDIDASDIGVSSNFSDSVRGFIPVFYTDSINLKWLATVRGRLGMLAVPQLLLYASGGFAIGQSDVSFQAVCRCGPPLPNATQSGQSTTSNTQTGYAVGGGVEWKFAPNGSLKAEYLFADLGSQSTTITYNYGVQFSTGTLTVKDRYNIVRVGINYKFDWAAPAALVTKY
jgi:outer membrane immunogenic protein